MAGNIFTSTIGPIVKEMVKADAAAEAAEVRVIEARQSRARGPGTIGNPRWDSEAFRVKGEDDPKTVPGQFKAAGVPLQYHEDPGAFERRPEPARPKREPLVGRNIDAIEQRIPQIARIALWGIALFGIWKAVGWYMSPKAFELRANREHELQLDVGNKSRKNGR